MIVTKFCFEPGFCKMSYNVKVLAKCGRNLTESSIQTNRSQYFYNGTKLIKNVELENIGG